MKVFNVAPEEDAMMRMEAEADRAQTIRDEENKLAARRRLEDESPAAAWVRDYEGHFPFLVAMREIVRDGRRLTGPQERAVLRCKAREDTPAPRASAPSNPDPVTEPGIYERDGEFFKVQRSRSSGNLYAKRAVESTRRLTEAGEVVEFDFVYAPGAVARLAASDRMNEERARELAIRYGSCINCGRTLKRAESVERGIGPVCIKWFRW